MVFRRRGVVPALCALCATPCVPRRDDFPRAAEYFRLASEVYGRAYGPSDRRMVEASKRAKAMADRVGAGPAGGGAAPGGGGGGGVRTGVSAASGRAVRAGGSGGGPVGGGGAGPKR